MSGVTHPFDAKAIADAQTALPPNEILEFVVQTFSTLGDATRAKILYALTKGPLCVRDLAITIGVAESAVSHQLRMLRDRRLVKAVRREHNQIEYRLDDHHVDALFKEAEFHADHVRTGLADHPYSGRSQ